jgi:hypothetical protein
MVLGKAHPVVEDGPSAERRTSYNFPNGSVLVVAGIGNVEPTRLYSTEFALVLLDEAREFRLDEWEKFFRSLRWPICRRVKRLNASTGEVEHVPAQQIIGFTNPSVPTHWLNRRARQVRLDGTPVMVRVKTTIRDNPAYWDEARGELTVDGLAYEARMSSTTGARRKHLYEGVWFASEGQIFPEWELDENERPLQMVLPSKVPERVWYLSSIDFGQMASPTVIDVWAVSEDRDFYLLEQTYRRDLGVPDMARIVLDAQRRYESRGGIHFGWADSAEPRTIKDLNDMLTWSGGAGIFVGADKTRRGELRYRTFAISALSMLVKQKKIWLVEGYSKNPDEGLSEAGEPTNLDQELQRAIYREYPDSDQGGVIRSDEIDPSCADHAIDTAIFAVTGAHGRHPLSPEVVSAHKVWSYEWLMQQGVDAGVVGKVPMKNRVYYG